MPRRLLSESDLGCGLTAAVRQALWIATILPAGATSLRSIAREAHRSSALEHADRQQQI
jgi:hypothetical protein